MTDALQIIGAMASEYGWLIAIGAYIMIRLADALGTKSESTKIQAQADATTQTTVAQLAVTMTQANRDLYEKLAELQRMIVSQNAEIDALQHQVVRLKRIIKIQQAQIKSAQTQAKTERLARERVYTKARDAIKKYQARIKDLEARIAFCESNHKEQTT